eukprot:TRINITY_DN5109_c0_g1_i5.p1 TRINITY_DN5109_c0_g1~~TRINITY_DN5109_c0_g1_i5.p1  ORF type:complete len:268 (-),score=43.94 TRINITY_DN5109_c0_g1_i5:169-972(-)
MRETLAADSISLRSVPIIDSGISESHHIVNRAIYVSYFFFFNDTATTEIYTRSIVGSVRCVQETGVNGGLLDKIVKQVWAKSKSSFRSGDLPPDSVHPITIPGLAMIIPDVILDYSRHEEVLLGLSGATVNPAVTLSVLNSTHGIAHGFQISFSFSVKNTEILKLQVPFDIVISPYSTKRGETAYFNLRTHTAQITQAVRAESKYHTVVKSNAQEAAIEYLNYLFMSNLGYALLGDGVSLKDELTPYSQLSNSVANYAFCLSLLLND